MTWLKQNTDHVRNAMSCKLTGQFRIIDVKMSLPVFADGSVSTAVHENSCWLIFRSRPSEVNKH